MVTVTDTDIATVLAEGVIQVIPARVCCWSARIECARHRQHDKGMNHPDNRQNSSTCHIRQGQPRAANVATGVTPLDSR